jgi:galactose mutarotase-like enzyme
MMPEPVVLTSRRMRVAVQPARGGEIASVFDLDHDLELLMSTPWAQRACSLPFGDAIDPETSERVWMERYAGGWQILFPHAGPAAAVDGVDRVYHGEASSRVWAVVDASQDHVRLKTDLESMPVAIVREATLSDAVLRVRDTVTNLGAAPISYDFVHHPAFGAPFLDGECVIETGARRYVADPRYALGELEPGRSFDWPHATNLKGQAVRLDRMPGPRTGVLRFGWLEGFVGQWAALRHPGRGLAIALAWSDPKLGFAWFWQEAGATRSAPWGGDGYAMALEPSSTPTGGPRRRSLTLKPHESRSFDLTLALLPGDRVITSVAPDGAACFAPSGGTVS